jgi:hydroxypyruvate reductase
VVKLTGSGLGGRNQELALAAAEGIAGLDHVCVFAVGSDGTDGPTDAAGGYVDADTSRKLLDQGMVIADVLHRNDSYTALKAVDGLIVTGPTGTNVNDLYVLLMKSNGIGIKS